MESSLSRLLRMRGCLVKTAFYASNYEKEIKENTAFINQAIKHVREPGIFTYGASFVQVNRPAWKIFLKIIENQMMTLSWRNFIITIPNLHFTNLPIFKAIGRSYYVL